MKKNIFRHGLKLSLNLRCCPLEGRGLNGPLNHFRKALVDNLVVHAHTVPPGTSEFPEPECPRGFLERCRSTRSRRSQTFKKSKTCFAMEQKSSPNLRCTRRGRSTTPIDTVLNNSLCMLWSSLDPRSLRPPMSLPHRSLERCRSTPSSAFLTSQKRRLRHGPDMISES